MPKMVFDEQYGDLTFAQRAAYRKYNVSPSEHDDLVRAYGEDHAKITAAVKRHSGTGNFDAFTWWREHEAAWWSNDD